MIDLNAYMSDLMDSLAQSFDSRLLYVGLQGSYLRGEADEESDLDIMVVLDRLTIADMDSYREIIGKIGNRHKACGFICGKSELQNWNPCEICQLIHTTKDYYGTLTGLVPSYTEEDEKTYIKISLDTLYHELCHRYIYASRKKNIEQLPATYKSVFFILQNIHYQRTGNFILTKRELLSHLPEEDKIVLQKAVQIKTQEIYDFEEAFQTIFLWCQKAIARFV